MNIIKVKTINEDGSVAFEGYLGPNEVQMFLETGINFMLQEGVISMMDQEEEDEEEAVPAVTHEGNGTLN